MTFAVTFATFSFATWCTPAVAAKVTYLATVVTLLTRCWVLAGVTLIITLLVTLLVTFTFAVLAFALTLALTIFTLALTVFTLNPINLHVLLALPLLGLVVGLLGEQRRVSEQAGSCPLLLHALKLKGGFTDGKVTGILGQGAAKQLLGLRWQTLQEKCTFELLGQAGSTGGLLIVCESLFKLHDLCLQRLLGIESSYSNQRPQHSKTANLGRRLVEQQELS